MLNGISAAISAIRTLEKKLSVTANNTANVNTQGFKASNASSEEVFPQNVSTTAGASQALNKIGNNLYSRTTASGDAITGMPGTNGLGPIIPGALEPSNVDLGTEAVKLIMIQRSLQANLSVIRTEDELKGDLIDIIS